MRRSVSKTSGHRPGIRIDRVLSRKSGRPLKTRLGEKVQQAVQNWETFDSKFIIMVNENCYALKIYDAGFDETFSLIPLVVRRCVVLIGMYGVEPDLDRKRLLGYVFLFVGSPTVYPYTFFLTLCYSNPNSIGSKQPTLIYCDKSLYMFKFGMGKIEYFFGYRDRRKEHDLEGTSTGSMHKETSKAWRDGM